MLRVISLVSMTVGLITFVFIDFHFRSKPGETSELRLGEPGSGGSHLQGRLGEPKRAAGETGARAVCYRHVKDIEHGQEKAIEKCCQSVEKCPSKC